MKRFYKEVSVAQAEDGFRVLLDGRSVKTPAKHALALPTRALADAVAAEWRGQGEEIAPAAMPFLRLANTVIDGVAEHRAEVIAAILRFGGHDLLCYRAAQPADLAARQREGWEPVLDWARRRHGVDFAVVEGFTHADQPAATLAVFRAALEARDSFSLAALHVVASVTGSVVLALALAEGVLTPAQAFSLSRIDEDYQAAKWGGDSEAQARAAGLAREIDAAAAFIAAARPIVNR
jgi:chaperone required for assembly of F1-ATPase